MSKLEEFKTVTIIENREREDRRCCRRGEKEYRIVSPQQKLLFKAKESRDCCCRECGCCWNRDFKLHIEDARGQKRFEIYKNRVCMSCFSCFSCCRHRLTLSEYHIPPVKIGRVQNDCRVCCTCYPKFSVYDQKDDEVYVLKKDVDCCAAMCGEATKCCCCTCVIPKGYTIRGKAQSTIKS
eukprot:TRINITY_DN57232_c0_g1_i2.p1 TRINITY_DN57232_c0_g1~~TRINITY_DN57232_c0_g1_i2.p1  ORF type:complete len:181 (+),score=76.41 TRINITY_DN57232_c0_g1_i2:52-594(+)